MTMSSSDHLSHKFSLAVFLTCPPTQRHSGLKDIGAGTDENVDVRSEDHNGVKIKLTDDTEERPTTFETTKTKPRDKYDQYIEDLKELFSKLYIDHKNRLTVLWKPEFDGLISSPNMHNVNNGDPGGARILRCKILPFLLARK